MQVVSFERSYATCYKPWLRAQLDHADGDRAVPTTFFARVALAWFEAYEPEPCVSRIPWIMALVGALCIAIDAVTGFTTTLFRPCRSSLATRSERSCITGVIRGDHNDH